MKVALVHELLTMHGGAENVLTQVANSYPDADVYTLLYNKTLFLNKFCDHKIITSTLQQKLESLPIIGKYIPLNHHVWLPLFATTVKQWDFSSYDAVISFSSSFAHQITVPPNVKHISYIHSPARYLWDRTHDVTTQASTGLFGWCKKTYLQYIFHTLRITDASIEHKNCTLLAASNEVKRRIELYWREQSTVLYPAISNYWLTEDVEGASPTNDYFLVVSTLAKYKRIHLAIKACNTLKLPLKIIGSGPELKYLQAIAGPTIEFLGRASQQELKTAYFNAKAVLFVGEEDFGLVPLEAMSQGTPVIAYKAGGALETVIEGSTGVFFTKPTVESVVEALAKFDHAQYNASACRTQAAQFTESNFMNTLQSILLHS